MEEDMNCCLCTENRVLYNYCEFTKFRLLWQPAVRGIMLPCFVLLGKLEYGEASMKLQIILW